MYQSNRILNLTKFLLFDFIWDFFYFPIWWYSKGLIRFIHFDWRLFKNGMDRLAIDVWVKNIFVPMFGQYDWQGRLISFFMRLTQIIIRTVLLIVWFVVPFVLLLVWVIMPLVILYGLYLQLVMLLEI